MNLPLNCTPHESLEETIPKLFNRSFLSDVKIIVGDRSIPAHSLVLTLRSVIFEEEFKKSSSDQKEVTVNYKYESVFEFIRFIYTDVCEINDRNGIDLLQLAVKYQFTKLENLVVNSLDTTGWFIQLFEYCVIGKYETARHQSKNLLILHFAECLENEIFLSLERAAVKEAIQICHVENGVTEIQIFNGLAGWINNYCKQNQMSLAEGGLLFDDLIKEIRLPIISKPEYDECIRNYPGLISDTNRTLITQQSLYKGDKGENDKWNSKPRSIWKHPFELCQFNYNKEFETKITVSKDIMLTALWIGIDEKQGKFEIEIIADRLDAAERETIKFVYPSSECGRPTLISIGESTRLKPNFEYTIIIKYLDVTAELNLMCRTGPVRLNYQNNENCIEIIKASKNMLEMIFKSCVPQSKCID